MRHLCKKMLPHPESPAVWFYLGVGADAHWASARPGWPLSPKVALAVSRRQLVAP